MTKIIGLTGGIGSGKTTVAQYFSELGIPVYIADDAARTVMDDPQIIQRIEDTFGKEVINQNKIDRRELASLVFNNPDLLQKLNDIVHPAVRKHFMDWLSQQNHPFVIKEAAILFESGTYTDCDAIITVTAPLETRIQRVISRDISSREEVLQRINNQWSDDMRISKSDYVIENLNRLETRLKVAELAKKLLNQ